MNGLRFLLSVAVCSVACSDPAESPGEPDGGAGGASTGGVTAGGGSGGSSPSGGTGGSAVTCNDLSIDDAQPVDVTFTADAPPAAEGGAISDGTYFATEGTFYRMAPGPSVSFPPAGVRIAGTNWQQMEVDPDRGTLRLTGTVSVSGIQFTLEQTCPRLATERATYTATADQLTLYIVDRGATFGSVFTKQ